MENKRKQEIIKRLMDIYNNFEPKPEEMLGEPNMFWIISNYNSKYENKELIGGSWVKENCPEPLRSL